MQLPETNEFFFNGRRVAYVDEGDGEPIVFLHNSGISHRLFDHQISYFSKTNRVIAMDWIGFGASHKPKEIVYDAQLYIDQLSALKLHLELEQFNLVACCVGGSVAMLYADENPETVKTLTVITSATPNTIRGGVLGPTLSRVGSLKHNIIKLIGGSRFARWIIWPYIMKRQLGPKVYRSEPEFVDYCTRNYADSGVGHAFSSYDYFSHEKLDTLNPSKNFPPLLFIWGSDNPVLKLKKGQDFIKSWNGSKTLFIDQCGYMVMREAAQQVNKEIEDHLI